MLDAVPEPIFPEADAYPSCREPGLVFKQRSPIDQYVLAAVIATGTQLVASKKLPRRSTEI